MLGKFAAGGAVTDQGTVSSDQSSGEVLDLHEQISKLGVLTVRSGSMNVLLTPP